tara:strand:- start:2009 stop:2185 length:177 start_codon:yes stop_codon:yes gene_type:complete
MKKINKGDLVRYHKWYGIVTATQGPKLKKGVEVMVKWNGEQHNSWEAVDLLEVISERR